MDILPLYIVLLAVLPFVLVGFRLWPAGVLAASFGLWCAVQLNESISRWRPIQGQHEVWFFNPFAWQALFFLGAWCGWRGLKGGDPLAHQSLAVLAGGGGRARRVPDPLQLDGAWALRPVPRAASARRCGPC